MLSFVVLVATLGYASAIVCTPELCKGVDRDTPLNCAGSTIKNGGFCGCSDACAKVEGETCQATYMFGMIPAGRCEDGLECVHHTAGEHFRLGLGQCQKKQVSIRSVEGHVQTACEQMRAVQQISFVIYTGQWMAKCDAMGNFEPKQCDNQRKCFCVDIKSGALTTERQLGDVQCSASVNTWSHVSIRSAEGHAQTPCEQMRAVQQISFVIYTGQWMAKCDAMGNFEPKQCDNQRKCFCVDIKSGALTTERQLGDVQCSASVDTLSQVPFHPMSSRDVGRHAITTCEQAKSREMLSMVIYNGQWFPNCDTEGKFLSRQCDNQHKCFCVDTTSGKLLTERQLGYIDCSTVSGA